MTDKPQIAVIRYTPEHFREWENFIPKSSNGTIFHSQRFLSYHPSARFRHHHLLFHLRGKLRAVFTGAEVEGEEGLELHSHPGASYGGVVIKRGADFEDYYGVTGALVEYARKTGFRAINLTQTPLIYHNIPSQGVEFALAAHNFTRHCENLTQSVDLTVLGQDVTESLVDKTRNAYRQAVKKGLVYCEDVELSEENLADFHRILVENRRILGVTPAHTLEELFKLARISPDSLHLAFVEKEGERIAGLLHFICNLRIVLLFYVCHNREKQSLKPVPFLLTNTLNWAREAGFRELDFGISTVKGDPTWGLLKFKENFKARPFLRTTYRIQIK